MSEFTEKFKRPGSFMTTRSKFFPYGAFTTMSNTPKLFGYKFGTQDRSGLVPGGFIIWLVWEIVPGLRLGYSNGVDSFWGLESFEREQVRLVFIKALP